MNIRKIITAGLCALALSIGFTASYGTNLPTASAAAKQISLSDAKQIAVDHAGYTVDEVTFIKTKEDREDGRTIYEIEFLFNGVKYEYEIDAKTGDILEHDAERY